MHRSLTLILSFYLFSLFFSLSIPKINVCFAVALNDSRGTYNVVFKVCSAFKRYKLHTTHRAIQSDCIKLNCICKTMENSDFYNCSVDSFFPSFFFVSLALLFASTCQRFAALERIACFIKTAKKIWFKWIFHLNDRLKCKAPSCQLQGNRKYKRLEVESLWLFEINFSPRRLIELNATGNLLFSKSKMSL